MDLSREVSTWFWYDQNRSPFNRTQVLLSENGSRLATSIIAIILTLCSPYMFRIIKYIVSEWILPLRYQDSTDSDDERQRLLPANGQTGGRDRQSLRATLTESENSRDFSWRCMKQLRRGNVSGWKYAIRILMLIGTLGLVFVGWSTVGFFAANIASDKVGLSSSKICGIWGFDDAAGEEAGYRDDLKQRWKEERAGLYARNCYSNLDSVSTLSCGVFYNQSIRFSIKSRQKCPFASSDLCFDEPYSATTFDTGFIDASVIGINAPVRHRFKRTSTCSPLNMSEPYITRSPETVDDGYEYHYGSAGSKSYTFNTSGDPFKWLIPSYSVNAYYASMYPQEDFWLPRSELKPPRGSTLTLMFITSGHIFHLERSTDAIFHAEEPRYFDGDPKPYYYNADIRSRPLACVDRTELSSPDGKVVWDMLSPIPDGTPRTNAYWLTKLSLENSNTYKTLKWRLGESLLAQRRLSQYISLPLDANQWELEAGQMFAASLARIQYDAWSIAVGEDHDKHEYIVITPEEAEGKLCKIYKFKTIEYVNVSLLWFIACIILAGAIWSGSKPGFYSGLTRTWVFVADGARPYKDAFHQWVQNLRSRKENTTDETANDGEPVGNGRLVLVRR